MVERVSEHRLSGHHPILFRKFASGTAAAPSCNHQSDCPAFDPHRRALAEGDLARQRL
jgi:hypothetical protein